MERKSWYLTEESEVQKVLKTQLDLGLKKAEAEKRLKSHGKNEIKGKKKDSVLLLFLKQFCDFMVMVLLAAAIISAAFGEMLDAAMIMAIIVLNGILGFVQEYKAEKSLEALKSLYVDETMVVRDGIKCSIPASNVVFGDVVILNQGDKIPADIRLMEAYDLEIEESLLTGESHPVSKICKNITEELPLAERKNMCYSGTTIIRGRGKGIVVATGMETEMGKIAQLLSTAKSDATPLQKRLNALGKWLIFFCVIICAAVSILGVLMGGDLYTMVLTGVSLGVASIPEGLPAIVTICLALGVWRLAKCHAIVKKLPAVETLGSTTVICTDKTGTLTQNTMKAVSLFAGGDWQEIKTIVPGKALVNRSVEVMERCHSLMETDCGICGDGTELALYHGANTILNGNGKIYEKEAEIPFNSERKMMSVLINGVSYVKGAPSVILQHCNKVIIKENKEDFPYSYREMIRNEVEAYSKTGHRILALAYKDNVKRREEMETGLTFLSLVAIEDPIREDAYGALEKAQKAGIKIAMITGDDKGTAFAVGKSLGIAKNEKEVILGKDINGVDLKKKNKMMDGKTIFARVNPEDKMKIVRYYKARGEVVAMTGDGVNDAPALKEADIGIAMGKRGTDVTKEAGDFIITDDNFASIVEAVFQGRGIYANIRKFIRYLLSSNLGEVLTMFIAVLFSFPLPLLPLQILWINLVTDGLPALALGLDKPSDSLMSQKPRRVEEGIFSQGLGYKIVLRGILIGVTTIVAFLYGIVAYGDIDVSRTMAFTTLVFCQLFYVFDCRSEFESHFSLGLLTNPWLLGAVGVSVIMQCIAIYLPWCQKVFHTAPLITEQWILILLITFLPSVISYLYYLIGKKIQKK